MFDAEIAQPGNPARDPLRRKAELGDDVNAKPGLLGRLDLGGERAVEHVGG